MPFSPTPTPPPPSHLRLLLLLLLLPGLASSVLPAVDAVVCESSVDAADPSQSRGGTFDSRTPSGRRIANERTSRRAVLTDADPAVGTGLSEASERIELPATREDDDVAMGVADDVAKLCATTTACGGAGALAVRGGAEDGDDFSNSRDGTAGADDPNIPDGAVIEEFERLDKWKGCQRKDAGAPPPQRLVYAHNRSRAAATGFPSILQVGTTTFGLTDHEVAVLFGWTTGDYRFVNPIARGKDKVVFEDYPFLPNKLDKLTFVLERRDVLPYVRILGSALSKLPSISSSSTSQTVLWRGHRRKISGRIGDTLVLKGFTSASRDRDNALTFAEKTNEGRSDERTLIAFVEHSSSRCLSKFSARRDEMEYLFPRDTAFEIVAAPNDRSSGDDESAVRNAMERLRRVMPKAEIRVVYLKEAIGQD